MKRTKYNSGLTFVEMLVTLAIFSIVMVAVSGSVLFFYRANSNALEQAYAISSARRGVEFLVRDIREAAYSDDGAYPVVSIATSSVTFYSDTDRDASVERMRYYLDGETLYKGVTNATGSPPVYSEPEEISIISEDVRNPEQGVDIFEYYDDTGTEITSFTNVTDVAFVTVNLIVNVNPTRLPEEFTLRSSATLRNLKTNL